MRAEQGVWNQWQQHADKVMGKVAALWRAALQHGLRFTKSGAYQLQQNDRPQAFSL
jgi:hypothetical protein